MLFQILHLQSYLDSVTSNIQTQLNSKQSTITGGATSIASSNLTASRALVSDNSGKVAISDVTSTELGYLDGVTSKIQTQLDGKAASSHNHSASNITSDTLSSDRLPTIPINKGGTGATDAATAVTNLGAMSAANPTGTGSFSLNRANGASIGLMSFAACVNTTASGFASHAEGRMASAAGIASHAEGDSTYTYGDQLVGASDNDIQNAWDINKFSWAKGNASHVEGKDCLALGECSHAEGLNTRSTAQASHSEGYNTRATFQGAHAEGNTTFAMGVGAHSEGLETGCQGAASHAEGYQTRAAKYAHAEGCYTEALDYQHAQGHYNNTTNAKVGVDAGTSTGTAFVIGNGTSSASGNAFRVTYDGTPYSKQALTTTGCDYAEFFEWQDLNPDDEDRRGYFVTLDGDKIKIAEPDDYILGIISGQPSVIGNGDEDWLGRYVFDDFGAFVYEEFEYETEIPEEVQEEVTDEETGETTIQTKIVMKTVTKTGTRYKENPDYDPTRAYDQREDRPEWDAVGMLGVLSVRDDGTCKVNSYCKVDNGGIATASETGYRVIKRVNDHIVKVIFK